MTKKMGSATENARQATALVGQWNARPSTGGAAVASSDPLAFIPPPNDLEFLRFQRLIQAEAGIHLPESKRSLLTSRLQRRLRELGLRSFHAYYRHVTHHDPCERERMLDCICTNETRFFREPKQLGLLVEHVVPRWRQWADRRGRGRRLRVWSAGCSSGEEPYSLAMLLLTHLPPHEGWSVDILATDLSTRALASAREGVYRADRYREIPHDLFASYMRRGAGQRAGTMSVGPEARGVVRFARHNLCSDVRPDVRPFDLVLCRNVLIYFDVPTKKRVVARLLEAVDPEGLLFLGHSEALSGSGHGLRSIGPMAYVRASAADLWA